MQIATRKRKFNVVERFANAYPALDSFPVYNQSTTWWGYEVHERIHYKAAHVLAGSFGDFTEKNAQKLALFGPVADYLKDFHPEENPCHFIDADYYSTYPFTDFQISYSQLEKRFGADKLKEWGIAPWAIVETAEILTKMFTDKRWAEALYYMGHLRHLVADLHMPLHTCSNYNGQFTGNDGVHFRWETRMVDELIPEFNVVVDVQLIEDYLGASLQIVRDSFAVYPRLLRADSLARTQLSSEHAAKLNTYDELRFEGPYLQILYTETEDVVHDRLGRAVAMTASFWWSCWLAAGAPEPPR